MLAELGVSDIAKVLADYGAGAIFLALYVTTLWYHSKEIKSRNKELKENKDEVIAITKLVTTAIDRAREATDRQSEMVETMRESLDANKTQTLEFLAYLRGRDARGPQ